MSSGAIHNRKSGDHYISVDQAGYLGGDAMLVARAAATKGSHKLLTALLVYGSRHALPRMSTVECVSRLREMKPLERLPDPRERTIPSDFARLNRHMSRTELQHHYRASDTTIGRWRRELGT